MARALDAVRVLTTYDAHDTKTVEVMFPQLSSVDLDDSMYVVSARGRVYRGFFAFRRPSTEQPADLAAAAAVLCSRCYLRRYPRLHLDCQKPSALWLPSQG